MTVKAKFPSIALAVLAALLCPTWAGAAILDFEQIVELSPEGFPLTTEVGDFYATAPNNKHVVFGYNSTAARHVNNNPLNVGDALIRNVEECNNDPLCGSDGDKAPQVELTTIDGYFFNGWIDFKYWAIDPIGGIHVYVFDKAGALLNLGFTDFGNTDWASIEPLKFDGEATRLVFEGDAQKFAIDDLELNLVGPDHPVPEPASYALVMLALAASAVASRRRKH